MDDFNFLAVIIGHPRFTCEHALDLLDFILDITLNNLIIPLFFSFSNPPTKK